MKSWFSRLVPSVGTPAYTRDNIHVSLLAKVYEQFAKQIWSGVLRINPSGYVESQGCFAQRLAIEMEKRLGFACEVKLNEQASFLEPLVRVNTDPAFDPNWSETSAWDGMAQYYAQLMRA